MRQYVHLSLMYRSFNERCMDDHHPDNAQGYHDQWHGIRGHGPILHLNRMYVLLRLVILC
jgi:hypothetical protein